MLPEERKSLLTGCVVGVGLSLIAVLWAWTHLTAAGQELDAGSFYHVAPVREAYGDVAATMRGALPPVVAALVAVLGLVSLRRRSWHRVAVAVGIVSVSLLVAVLARTLLVRPDLGGFGYAHNTFPSVNVAAVAGLCAAAWVLWPWGGRAVVLGCCTTVALGAAAASVVTYAHRPSDVVGSLLLVVVVGSVALALPSGQPRTPS